jgi:hypothetical protein
MLAKDAFTTYIHYLIHPFKSHQALQENDKNFLPGDITLYESLGISWLFILLGAFFRLIFISFLISVFVSVMDPATDLIEQFYRGDRYVGFYFVILSTLLDVIFFPLITLVAIQFWDLVIKFFVYISGIEGNSDEKVKDILSVALSSNLLYVIPIIGAAFGSLAQVVQMYAGLREQFKFSPLASILILTTPYFVMMGFVCFILLLIILRQL